MHIVQHDDNNGKKLNLTYKKLPIGSFLWSLLNIIINWFQPIKTIIKPIVVNESKHAPLTPSINITISGVLVDHLNKQISHKTQQNIKQLKIAMILC